MAGRDGAVSSAMACLLAAGTAALLFAAAAAQSGGSGCTAALVSLYPCLNYTTGADATPAASCCSQLKIVVRSEPQCLCAALGSDSSSLGGITINKTRALELPKACNVVTPPASKCDDAAGGGTPPAAPTTTPAVQTPGMPSSAGAGTGSGSKATPTPTVPYLINGGASLRGPVGLVLGFAAVAVYAMAAV